MTDCIDDSCYTVTRCGGSVTCEINDCPIPKCPAGTTQVGGCGDDPACTTVTSCELVVFCSAACTDVPVCDGGDTPADEGICTPDVACYTVMGCNGIVACNDVAPLRPCPNLEPIVGSDCSDAFPGLVCDYPSNPLCFHELVCSEAGEAVPTWTDNGLVCEND